MKLGGRQLEIMRVLWEHGELSVADVQTLLDVEKPLAYSTISTVLSRMEQKGLVSHRSVDRVFYYRPVVTRAGAGKSMVGDLIERVFGGSPSALVNHLLDSSQVDNQELQRIKQLVQEHDARLRKQRGGEK